jgi:hypothetical protein
MSTVQPKKVDKTIKKMPSEISKLTIDTSRYQKKESSTSILFDLRYGHSPKR